MSQALVRFVYARCGAVYDAPGRSLDVDQRGPRKVKSSETEALQRAVQEPGFEGALLGRVG